MSSKVKESEKTKEGSTTSAPPIPPSTVGGDSTVTAGDSIAITESAEPQMLVLSFDGRVEQHSASNEPWIEWNISETYKKVAKYCVITRKLKIHEDIHPQSWIIYDKRAGDIIECEEECVCSREIEVEKKEVLVEVKSELVNGIYEDVEYKTEILTKEKKELKIKRVKLANNQGWASLNDVSGKRNISTVDGDIENWTKVKQKYIYFDNASTTVRQDISEYSLFYNYIKAGDVIDTTAECIIEWQGSKIKRLRLEKDKGWTDYNDLTDGRFYLTKLDGEIALDAYKKLDAFYLCISRDGDSVRTDAAISSGVVGKVRLGDVISTTDEVIVPHKEDSLKIKRVRVVGIESTTRLPAKTFILGWSSIHSVIDGERMFSQVDCLIESFKKVKQKYLCCADDGVRIRRDALLRSKIVKTFKMGELFSTTQEFIIPLSGSLKLKSVFLKNGSGFTNILGPNKIPQVYPVDGNVSGFKKLHRKYLCLEDVDPVEIRQNISLESEVLFTLNCGDLVDTCEECYLDYIKPKIRRLKCEEEGGWVNYNQMGKQLFSWIEGQIENYKRIRRNYLCCTPTIIVQLDAAVSSDQIGEFKGGDLLETTDEVILLMDEGFKLKRLKLVGDGWVSWNGKEDANSYLTIISEQYERYKKVSRKYLCIYTTQLWEDVSLDSRQLFILKAGDIITTTDEVFLVFPTHKTQRIRLSDGKWTSWNLPNGRAVFCTVDGPIQDYVRIKRQYMVTNWDNLKIQSDMPIDADVIKMLPAGTVINTTEECTLIFDEFSVRRTRLSEGTWATIKEMSGYENLTLVDGTTLNYKRVEDYYLYVDNGSVPVRKAVSLKSDIVGYIKGGDQIRVIEECIILYGDFNLKRLRIDTGGWTSLISTEDGHKLFTSIDGFITDYKKEIKPYFTCCLFTAQNGLSVYKEASLHSQIISFIKPGKVVPTFQECTISVKKENDDVGVRRLRVIDGGGWLSYNNPEDPYNYLALIDSIATDYKKVYQKFLVCEDIDVAQDVSPNSKVITTVFSGSMISTFEECFIPSESHPNLQVKRVRLENGLGWCSYSSDIDGHQILFRLTRPVQSYRKVNDTLLYVGADPLPVNKDVSIESPSISTIKAGDVVSVVDECSYIYDHRRMYRMRLKDSDNVAVTVKNVSDGWVSRNRWEQSIFERILFSLTDGKIENFKFEERRYKCLFKDLLYITSDVAVSSKLLNDLQPLKNKTVIESIAECTLVYPNPKPNLPPFRIRKLRLKGLKGWIIGSFTNSDDKSIDLVQRITLKVQYQDFKQRISDILWGEEDTFDFRIGLFTNDLNFINEKADRDPSGGGLYDVDIEGSDEGAEEYFDDDREHDGDEEV